MANRYAWIAAAVLLVGGCSSSGLSPREERDNTIGTMALEVSPTTQPMVQELPKFERPMRIAVAQVGEVAPPTALLDKLQGRPDLFGSVDPIPAVGGVTRINSYREVSDKVSVQSLMGLARQMGDRYLLVYGGTIDSATQTTPLAILDLTIVGAFIVPSRHLMSESHSAGILIDLKENRVVKSITSEVRDSALSSAATEDGTRTGLEAHMRDHAIADMGDQLVKKVDGTIVR